MAATLPDALLNRVNKSLKEECERALAEVRRFQAITRLESETLRAAEVKTAAAKERFANVTRMEAQIRFKLAAESEQLSQLEVHVSKLTQDLNNYRVGAKDALERAELAAKRAEAAREKLHEAEARGSAMEQEILNWIEENKITAGATDGATQILDEREKIVSDLHREAAQLSTKSRRLEAELADEVSIRDTVLVELQRCRSDAAAAQQEILRIQADMIEAQQKAEEERESRRDPRDELEDARRKYVELRREADEGKAEHKVAEQQVDQTQNAIYAIEHTRARTLLRMNEVQAELNNLERELRVLQAQSGITASGSSAVVRQIESLRDEKATAVDRLHKVESKVASLRDALRMAEDDAHALTCEDDLYKQLLTDHSREVLAYEGAMDAGMAKMQRMVTQHAEACARAAEQNDRILALQDAVRKAAQEEATLKSRLRQLDDALSTATDDIAQLTNAIDQEERELREMDGDKRRELKNEVERLREQHEEVDRMHIKLRREVDATVNELRQASVFNDAQQAAIAELNALCEDVRAETATLQADAGKQSVMRGEKGAQMERLEVQLELLRKKVAQGSSTVAVAQYERAVAEAEAAQREAVLVAQIDAARVELHSAEAERRSLSLRLQEGKHKESLLQSRHSSMMQSIANKVNAEIAEAAAAEMAMTKATTSAAEGALIVSASSLDGMSPDDLTARCLLARATQREALMTKGNALDDTIVRAEKDTKTLNDAIAMLRQREDDGALALVDAEGAEIDRFIEDVQQRFATTELIDLERDLLFWDKELEELTERLRTAKAASLASKQELETAQQRKQQCLGVLRQAERALQQLTTVATQERLRTERSRTVVRVTQQSVLSDERSAQRLHEQRERRQLQDVEEQLWQLVQRASARHGGSLEVFYRRMAAAFGINIPSALQPVLGNFTPSSARSSSSQAKSTAPVAPSPAMVRRPATAALVAAMTERRVLSHHTSPSLGGGLQIQGRASSASRAPAKRL